MSTTMIRIAAWLTFLFIAFATLSPIGLRPLSSLPVDIERALAFSLVGFLFAIAYPRQIWLAAGIIIIGVVGLELLQNLRPDRHGRNADAVVKLAGGAIGLGFGWLAAQVMRRFSRG